MNFMQVFQKPGKPARSTMSLFARTLEDATREGLELADQNPELWGEFLYARLPVQQLIKIDEFYVLKPSQPYFHYRKEAEAMFAPLDYLRYSGPNKTELEFPLTWRDVESGGAVYLNVWFNAGRSFKFQDLCENYLAKFILRDGKSILQFCDELTLKAVGEIQLESR